MTETSFDIPTIGAAHPISCAPAAMEREIEALIVEICLKYNLPEDRAPDALNALVRNQDWPTGRPTVLPRFAPEIYAERRVVKCLQRRENIVEFLRRVWGRWIEQRLLTRCVLRKLDPSADKAVENLLRRESLPDDVYLPSFPKRPSMKGRQSVPTAVR